MSEENQCQNLNADIHNLPHNSNTFFVGVFVFAGFWRKSVLEFCAVFRKNPVRITSVQDSGHRDGLVVAPTCSIFLTFYLKLGDLQTKT